MDRKEYFRFKEYRERMDFKREMAQIHQIKDAAMDLYEAGLAIRKAFLNDGERTFSPEEREAWSLLLMALLKAETEND